MEYEDGNLDADDCWDIVMGTELEPNELAVVVGRKESGSVTVERIFT